VLSLQKSCQAQGSALPCGQDVSEMTSHEYAAAGRVGGMPRGPVCKICDPAPGAAWPGNLLTKNQMFWW